MRGVRAGRRPACRQYDASGRSDLRRGIDLPVTTERSQRDLQHAPSSAGDGCGAIGPTQARLRRVPAGTEAGTVKGEFGTIQAQPGHRDTETTMISALRHSVRHGVRRAMAA